VESRIQYTSRTLGYIVYCLSWCILYLTYGVLSGKRYRHSLFFRIHMSLISPAWQCYSIISLALTRTAIGYFRCYYCWRLYCLYCFLHLAIIYLYFIIERLFFVRRLIFFTFSWCTSCLDNSTSVSFWGRSVWCSSFSSFVVSGFTFVSASFLFFLGWCSPDSYLPP